MGVVGGWRASRARTALTHRSPAPPQVLLKVEAKKEHSPSQDSPKKKKAKKPKAEAAAE